MNLFHGLQVELLDGSDDNYTLNWGGAGHIAICDDFSRLYMLKSGCAEVRIKDRVVVLTPGRLYLFPCGSTAWYRCIEPMELCWIHFRLEYLPGIDLFSRFEPTREAYKIKKADREFGRVLKGLDADSPEAFFRAVRALLHLTEPFLPSAWNRLNGTPLSVLRIRPALDYIQANFANPDLSLKKIARTVHLQPTYFSNLFRETLGLTPIRLATDIRLRHARKLLLNTDQTVSEISLRCGYRDPFYFTRAFKKNTGQNPRQFRNMPGLFGTSDGR